MWVHYKEQTTNLGQIPTAARLKLVIPLRQLRYSGDVLVPYERQFLHDGEVGLVLHLVQGAGPLGGVVVLQLPHHAGQYDAHVSVERRDWVVLEDLVDLLQVDAPQFVDVNRVGVQHQHSVADGLEQRVLVLREEVHLVLEVLAAENDGGGENLESRDILKEWSRVY